MVNIAICEQDYDTLTLSKNLIESAVENYDVAHNIYCLDSFEKLDDLLLEKKVTILLLSTKIDNKLGIDYARKLRDNGNKSIIMFISDTPEYAISSFEVTAFFYFLKPPEQERFKFVFGRLFNSFVPKSKQTLTLKSGSEYKNFRLSEIISISSEGHKVLLDMKDGSSVSYFMKLDDIEKLIPKNTPFIRIHKSYLVNIAFMSSINSKFAVVNGQEYPVSRSNKNDAIQKFALLKK